MSRLILTFSTLTRVLAADKLLRDTVECRPTPTPPGLSSDICGVSVELLDVAQKNAAMEILEANDLLPSGIHDVN